MLMLSLFSYLARVNKIINESEAIAEGRGEREIKTEKNCRIEKNRLNIKSA